MNWWTALQSKVTAALTADVDVVRKVDALDQQQRKLGHDLRNIQMRIEPLRRLVEGMRDSGEERHHHG